MDQRGNGLAEAVRLSVRFLDNAIDVGAPRHPLRDHRLASVRSRRIGLGILGMADCFVMLGPADTRLSAIEGLYRKAWESGCKGITVFREGSRASVLERDESEGPHPTGTGSPAGVCTFCEAPTTEDPRAGG